MDRRLTPRGRERRSQLMGFAAARFADQGYHPTSVAEIVGGLGVGKGVFYWYFRSKEELFEEILREAQHDLRRFQAQAIGDEPDPIARIELGIRASLTWFEAHRDLYQLFQFAVTEQRFLPEMRRQEDIAVEDLMRHVKDALIEGRIPDGDPLALTHAIIGVTRHMAREFMLRRGDPASEVADVVVAFCRHGLLGS
ncbi:MAG: TetR/AcrR family transcriptional regulator [Acidimicrobiales bacterium]